MTTDPIVTLFTAMFCEPGAIDQAASLISVEDFEQDDHRRAYQAMLDLAQAGRPIDVALVCDRLQELGMSDVAACELVERLTDGEPIIGGIPHYVQLIRKGFRRRRLLAVTEAALERATDSVDPGEVMRELQENLWKLQSANTAATGAVLAKAAMLEFLNQAATERTLTKDLGLSTGVDRLDVLTTGIRAGELWVVGALPGRGKTSFAEQAAVKAVERGVPVLFFSAEMTRTELMRRALGARHGVWQMRNLRNISEEHWRRIAESGAEFGKLPLWIDDTSSLTGTDLAARSRAAIRERKVRLIVVDYLQLLRGPEREIRERVGNAANLMRQLAKDTQVPVLLLSQLRRPQDINTRPSMLDLKESGDIESHAHTALLLYSPIAKDGRPTGEDEIIIGKQRNGPLGNVAVYFDPRTLVFRSRDMIQQTGDGEQRTR